MKERLSRWAAPLFHVVGVLVWGYVAMHLLMRAFPPSESAVLAISSLIVFWLFVSGVAYLLVLLAVPDGWAPAGCLRLVLFGFGLVVLDSRKLGDDRMAFLRAADFTLWPIGRGWYLSPSYAGWITRLWRRLRRWR